MINTVIFDLDGLLIDSEIISYHIYNDLVGRYGHTLSVEEYARTYSGKTAVKNMTTIIENFKIPLSLEGGLAYADERERYYFAKGVPLKKGAAQLLKDLKDNDYQILLASSSYKERAENVLDQNDILDYFDDMVYGPEIEHGKPAPDIFLKAVEKAGEPADNCLVLEDSEAGVEAAYSAGIRVICVPDMKTPGDAFVAMTWHMLESLDEVMPLLKNQ